jgi:hypothetical protein
MNSVQQFPDISNKRRWILNNQRKEKLQAEQGEKRDKQLTVFYDNEFRKWHYKLTLIIVFILTCLFFVVYSLSALLS